MKSCLPIAVSAALMASLAVGASAQNLPETRIAVIGSSDQSYMHRTIERPFWTETIGSESGGAITVEFQGLLSSGLKGPEIVRLLRTGTIDFAHGVFQSVGADDPVFEGMDLAGLATDIETARAVVNAYKPVIDRNFSEKHGLKLLAMLPFTAQMFFCRDAISGLDELEGRKVRVFGRSLAELVSAAGASAVTIPFGEVVPALQTGVADCAITGVASGNSSKWYEVANYLYTLPVGWAISFYAVNLDRWESLDPQVRSFLQEKITQLEDDIWALTAEENQDGINCNAGKDPCRFGTKASMIVAPLQDSDKPKLKSIMSEVVVPSWAERCGEECVADWNATIGETVGITVE